MLLPPRKRIAGSCRVPISARCQRSRRFKPARPHMPDAPMVRQSGTNAGWRVVATVGDRLFVSPIGTAVDVGEGLSEGWGRKYGWSVAVAPRQAAQRLTADAKRKGGELSAAPSEQRLVPLGMRACFSSSSSPLASCNPRLVERSAAPWAFEKLARPDLAKKKCSFRDRAPGLGAWHPRM